MFCHKQTMPIKSQEQGHERFMSESQSAGGSLTAKKKMLIINYTGRIEW